MKLLTLFFMLFSVNSFAQTIYKTIPSTTIRDYSEMPGFVIE
jgi:hypothetical protein